MEGEGTLIYSIMNTLNYDLGLDGRAGSAPSIEFAKYMQRHDARLVGFKNFSLL